MRKVDNVMSSLVSQIDGNLTKRMIHLITSFLKDVASFSEILIHLRFRPALI